MTWNYHKITYRFLVHNQGIWKRMKNSQIFHLAHYLFHLFHNLQDKMFSLSYKEHQVNAVVMCQ